MHDGLWTLELVLLNSRALDDDVDSFGQLPVQICTLKQSFQIVDLVPDNGMLESMLRSCSMFAVAMSVQPVSYVSIIIAVAQRAMILTRT
jgi:hypothetical protein